MPAKRKAAGALLLGAMLFASSGPAFAAEITASVTGASAVTLNSRAKVRATDTAVDNHRADAWYKRGNASAAAQVVSADAGYGSTATSPSGTTIATVMACTQNNNPFDSVTCSSGMTL